MENMSNVTTNCSDLLACELVKIFNIVEAAAGAVSLLGCIGIIVLMILLRKYKDPAQRIVLYLTVAVIMNTTNSIVRGGGHQLIQEGDKTFCTVVGFFSGYTSGCIIASVCCIVVELFIKVVMNKATGNCVNVFYFGLIFVLPAIIFAIPFITDSYGRAGATCWIRTKEYTGNTTCRTNNTDHENCSTGEHRAGMIEQYVLWYAPVFILLITGAVIYIVSLIVFNRKLQNYQRVYTSDLSRLVQQRALQDIKQFRWYPLIFFPLNIVPLIATLQIVGPENYALWIVTALIDGFQGLFIVLAFTIDRQTRQKLNLRNIVHACSTCCSREPNEYLTLTKESKTSAPVMKYTSFDEYRRASKQSGD